MIFSPHPASTDTTSPFSLPTIRKLHDELMARIEEAKETRARTIKDRTLSGLPFPPDEASAHMIKTADFFCAELRQTKPSASRVLELATKLIDGKDSVYGAASLPLAQHYPGVSDILQNLHDLAVKAAAFFSEEASADKQPTTLDTTSPNEQALPQPASFVSSFSTPQRSALVDRHKTLDDFARQHGAALTRSPVPQDRILIDSVNLALALVEDYNKGLVPDLAEAVSSIKDAREVERDIRDSGGDLQEFPFTMATLARQLTQLVAINMREDKREPAFTEAKAPPLPSAPRRVVSILSKPENS